MQQQLPERGARVRIEVPVASLNLATFVSLYTCGYTNVHELGPLLDVNMTKIGFERRVEKKAGKQGGHPCPPVRATFQSPGETPD